MDIDTIGNVSKPVEDTEWESMISETELSFFQDWRDLNIPSWFTTEESDSMPATSTNPLIWTDRLTQEWRSHPSTR